jgi:hypothetical protein
MPNTPIGKLALAAGILSLLGGCQSLGPIAIDTGRDRYNNIIQSTTKQQAFENIIRVKNYEPTLFMDVTEVDATQTVTGSLSGAVTNIGARAGTSGGTLAGQVGSVTPGVSYSENPLIRYVPLIGQGLVEQTVAPINTDAIAALYDSNWSVMPLLDLAAAFLTLDHEEVGAALNLIAELNHSERLQLISTKSDWTKKPKDGSGGQGGTNDGKSDKKTPTSSSTNDALVIYFLPSHKPRAEQQKDWNLWVRLTRLYEGTQLPSCSPGRPSKNCTPATAPFIELRTMPVANLPTPSPFKYTAPSLRTLSALGILKSAAQPPYPRIEFVSRSEHDRIAHYSWNDYNKDNSLYVYTLRPEDLPPAEKQFREGDAERVSNWLDRYANSRLPYVWTDARDEEFDALNDRLWQLRRYMLIIQSEAPPPANAYVAYFDRGLWYYIAGDDRISQQNFNLISLFLTVMAIPPTSPPLTTSIALGGGG